MTGVSGLCAFLRSTYAYGMLLLQGFELNPGDWEPEANLADVKALDLWEVQQGRTQPASKVCLHNLGRGVQGVLSYSHGVEPEAMQMI